MRADGGGVAEVAALACRGVFSALCGPGAGGARGWWGAAPAHAARLLERLVRAYVAPPAARQQLRSLQQRAAELADVEVREAPRAGGGGQLPPGARLSDPLLRRRSASRGPPTR